MGYKIGSFNMRNIGLSSLSEDNARDLEKIAEIIRSEKFDVVALQEVLSGGKAFSTISDRLIKKSILMELGPDWQFQWADAESLLNDVRGEGYAFLWNSRRLQLASTILENNTKRTFNPRMCMMNKNEMARRPYYARFTPQGTLGGTSFEIRLICIHTYYGKDNIEDRKIRQHELDVLLKDIYPQVSERVYKGSMPAYTILLGDYNVELFRPWKEEWNRKKTPAYLKTDEGDVVIAKDWDNMRVITVQYQLTTLKKIEDEEGGNDELNRYSHDYDHFSFDEKRLKGIVKRPKRVDAVRKYCGDDPAKYLKTISDHLPISIELELK